MDKKYLSTQQKHKRACLCNVGAGLHRFGQYQCVMAMGAGLHLCVSGDVKLHAFLLLGARLHVLQLALRKHPHLFPGIVCSYTWSTCAQFFPTRRSAKKRKWRKQRASGGDGKMDVNTRSERGGGVASKSGMLSCK